MTGRNALLHVGILTCWLLAQAPSPAWADGADGTLVAAFAAEPTTLDPVRYSAGVDTYGISQLFEQLSRVGPSGKTVPWLAVSWTVEGTADKPVIDVHLRPGVTFQNGDPVTSADVEFSYERLRDPKQSRWSHLQASVESFEVVDDLHFRIHFSKPDANYLTDNLQIWVMPKKYFEQVGADGFARAPIGTGPWKLTSWKVKDEMQLQSWDGYWNKQARPSVRNLTIKFIPEDLTRVAAFRTDAVDWIDAVPPASIEDIKKMPDVSTATEVSGNNLFVNFPMDLPNTPFKDVRVRQAAAYAIDMDAIIKRVLFGQGQRYAEVGEGETGYDPALKPYPYDPRKARAPVGRGRLSQRVRYALLQPNHPARAQHEGNGRRDVRLPVLSWHTLPSERIGIRRLDQSWPRGPCGRPSPRRSDQLDVVPQPARRPRHSLGWAPAQLRGRAGLGQLLPHARRRAGRPGRATETDPRPGEAGGAAEADRADEARPGAGRADHLPPAHHPRLAVKQGRFHPVARAGLLARVPAGWPEAVTETGPGVESE